MGMNMVLVGISQNASVFCGPTRQSCAILLVLAGMATLWLALRWMNHSPDIE
jgi:hypothetical protein